MTSVVFLDIDGVLAVRQMQRVFLTGNRFPSLVPGDRIISRVAVQCLNRITDETGAAIVVSSTWRTKRDCPSDLARLGVTGQFHADWATDADGPDRGAEIARWLIAHGNLPYIVIDDWSRIVRGHVDRLVQTNFKVGLQPRDADRAVELLIA